MLYKPRVAVQKRFSYENYDAFALLSVAKQSTHRRSIIRRNIRNDWERGAI